MIDSSSLVDILLKVTVVLGIAPLAARALARGSAAARHQIWAVALVGSLLMPVLATVAPRWTIEVLPASAPVELPEAVAPPIASTTSADPIFEPTPALTPDLSVDTQSQNATVSRLSTVTTIWLAGVLLVLVRLAFGTARVWWIARRAMPAPVWEPLGQELAESLGIDRHVTFLSGDEEAMPMAWGFARAHVLLPAEADEWPIDRQRVVLLHELAHVKRRDSLTQMLAHVACAAYWFNPLVWLAAERLRAERERACDDLVLAAGTRGSDYADHLLDIARSLRSGAWPTWSAVTMAHRSQLEGRLMAILNPTLPRRSPTRRAVAAFATVACVSIVSLAGVRAVAKAAEAEEQGRPSALASPAPTPTPTPTPTPAPTPTPRLGIGVGVGVGAGTSVRHAQRAGLLPPLVAPVPAPPAPIAAPVVAPQAPPPPVPPVPPVVDLDIDQTIATAVNFAFAQSSKGPSTPADPKITAALTAALRDEDDDVRKQALNTLVRMRAPLPADVIASMLKDKSPDVRHQAIFAIGQQRDPKNVSLLADALKDANADVRQQAVAALGRIRDTRAVDPLITALKDSDPDVRKQAAWALGQIRDARAVDPLIAALKDPNADVRQQAVFALGQIR